MDNGFHFQTKVDDKQNIPIQVSFGRNPEFRAPKGNSTEFYLALIA